MKFSLRAIAVCLLIFSLHPLTDAFADNFSIGSFNLVGQKRVSRTDYEYTYTSAVTNNGADATNVSATVFSNSSHTTVVDGSLSFGTVAARASVPSSDTFTVRHNRRYPFSWDSLVWTISSETKPVDDSDRDGVKDGSDNCPQTPNPGQIDSDGDGMGDACDGCFADPKKTSPGICGCGISDTDSDGDGTADCDDTCPADSNKIISGVCGCGVPDTDSDADGVADCSDGCPSDSNKASPGFCGCGIADTDSDGDGAPDCDDGCPNDVDKTHPGECGCGVAETDSDGDGIADCIDDDHVKLPPDPAQVAPELDRTVATNLWEATEFLYTGDTPIQTGVEPGIIEPTRAAVLRGQVHARGGGPLAGVLITVLDYPEYGQTFTRADGMFDLSVNGGGDLTIRYRLAGHLEVQRRVTVPWLDFARLPDVVLIPLDNQVTVIDTGSTEPFQVARGSQTVDDRGTRRSTLLFPQGVQAQMMLADGSTQPLGSLSVRATEYTVGNNGPESMPCELPAGIGYTYAVEFSVDEAAGATSVQFDRPLINYVENFLGFPTGDRVPAWYYDKDQAAWLPTADGRVIEILEVSGDLAGLDTTGDGNADNGPDLGVTEEERRRIAALYSTGQSLWRVPVRHFTPIDYNWPLVFPPGSDPPNPPNPPAPDLTNDPEENPWQCSGSIIEVQNQILGERVGISGTPFTLNYRSDRVQGNRQSYTADIALTGDTLPPSPLVNVRLVIEIAGRYVQENFWVVAPDMTYTFTWDGLDAYGRPMQGRQRLTVRIGYTYTPRYLCGSGGGGGAGCPRGMPTTFWSEWNGYLGPWDARAQQLGGWTISAHHAYDPVSGVLYLGNGERQGGGQGFNTNVVTTVAGIFGEWGYSGDGGPATAAMLDEPEGIDVGPDGSVYFTEGTYAYLPDRRCLKVRRVAPDGTISTVAGLGSRGFSGDGGPAVEARFEYPYDVTVGPDGSLFITDRDNLAIRKVDPEGIITTLNSTWWGFDGDGGPVIDALITWPRGITAGPDGSVYFADADDNNRIRRIGPAGIITTVAGNGSDDEQADEEAPATAVSIGRPEDVALAPDGSLYVSDGYNYRILRVGPAVPRGGLADIRIPSQDGRQVYVFSGSGRHLRTLDALTGATLYLFTYDAQNLLTAITDAYGNNTTIERDARGTPLAVDGPYGQRTELAVDGNGYLTAITNPNGETNSFLYSEGGLLTTHSDPKGGNWAYTYGESGRLTRNDDPAGGYQTFERQDLENGYVVTRNTALGRTSTYQVTDTPTGEHRLVNSTGCCGTSEMVVNADGTRTITQADGTVKAVALGADPRFGMQAPFVRDMTVTTPGGLAMSVSRNRTVDLGNPDDPFSLSSQTDTLAINGKAYTRFFGADTLETTSTTPEGRQTRTVSDATGRVLERTLSGLATSAYSYDEQGRLTRVTHGTFPDRRTFSFGYGADGLLESLSDPLGRTTNLQRDVAGRLIAQILPDGRQIGFGYDANGNLNSVTPPGRPAHGLIRNAVNLLSDYAPPNIGILSTTTYAYNADRQLTQIHRPDNTTIEFNHQSDTGLLSSITADQGGTTYSYDPASGRLIGIDATGGQGLDLAYDGFLLTNQTWTEMISGSVDLTWNDDFRLATLSVNGSGEDLFSYDDDGLMTQAGSLTLSRNRDNGLVTATQLGGITDSIAYNEFAERINYTAGFGTTLLYDATYTRDKGGRVTSMTETIEGGTVSYQYSYDDDGRLTTVTINGDLTDIYSYDDNGNRTGHADGDGITSGTYDEQDRLLQYGDCTYNYTAAGELASKTENGQTTSFNYDALGNLRRVDLPDDTVISYVIDGLNRRVGKRINGTLVKGFLYQDQLRPVAELDGNGTLVSRFVYANRSNVPLYMVRGGAIYRIITDHRASVRLVVDSATGAVVQRINYDAFGSVINDTNPGFQPFGFAGGLYDPDTGLTRFGFRDYDAACGRWTAKDPILFYGGQANLYSYCLNDPINFMDINGLLWGEIGAGLLGVATTIVGAVVGGSVGTIIGLVGAIPAAWYLGELMSDSVSLWMLDAWETLQNISDYIDTLPNNQEEEYFKEKSDPYGGNC